MSSMYEIAKVAYAAGVTDVNDLGRAVAIAYAESGGNPNAHNTRPPDDSYGLWQINLFGDLGPQRRKQFGLTSDSQLLDPATNAKAMVAISNGGKNWKPWSTYMGLRYLSFIPAAGLAAAAAQKGSPANQVVEGANDAVDKVDKVGDAAAAASDALGRAGGWLSNRNNWFRIGKTAIGAALVIAGLNAATRGYATKALAPIVGAVAPVGKVAKAVGGMTK